MNKKNQNKIILQVLMKEWIQPIIINDCRRHHKRGNQTQCAFCWMKVLLKGLKLTKSLDLITDLQKMQRGVPCGSEVESACRCRGRGFNPWIRKIPWRRKWQFIPEFLPGKSHGQRSLAGYRPCGRKRFGHDLVSNNMLDNNNVLVLSFQTLVLLTYLSILIQYS